MEDTHARRRLNTRMASGTNVACFSIFISFPLSDSSFTVRHVLLDVILSKTPADLLVLKRRACPARETTDDGAYAQFVRCLVGNVCVAQDLRECARIS